MTKHLALLLLIPHAAFAIIGGEDVNTDDAFAHSVAAIQVVEHEASGKINRYKGTGVLISDRVLLTAGHNFFYIPDPTASEVIFDVAPKWGPDAAGQKRIHVARVAVYPGWRQIDGGTENDLALVFLAEPAPSDYKPLEMETVKDFPAGAPGLVLGYGFNRNPEDLNDFRLRRTRLTFQNAEPQKLWFSDPTASIAGGDSGGPVIYSGHVYGIAIHRGQPQRSAFSRLSFFREWLEENDVIH